MLSQQLPTVNFQKNNETAHDKLLRIVQENLPEEEENEEDDDDLFDDARNTSFQVRVYFYPLLDYNKIIAELLMVFNFHWHKYYKSTFKLKPGR